MNAIGTILGLIMPSMFPACHKFKECGSYFIGTEDFPKLIEDSPDGIIECDENCSGQTCRNIVGYPIGKIVVEIKCPYSPISNPAMLPIAYQLPHYNACQVLTHMKAVDCNVSVFVSCGLQSTSVSFVDFDNDTWNKLFNFSKEMFADPEIRKPTESQPECVKLKSDLKEYCENNCVLIAEIPTLLTVDDQTLVTSRMPSERNKMYRIRKDIGRSTVDWQSINDQIIDLCDENRELLQKCNEALRRKATELLLFVASDTDREFNKDVPSCIPIAYGLKGKSIRMDTARKMINVLRNDLKDKGLRILAESLDGQWAPMVFRDADNNPLTLYELDKDCWIKFAHMGKKNILKYMETFSHVSVKNMEGLAKPERFTEGRYRNGNVGFDVNFKLNDDKDKRELVMFLSTYSFCGQLDVPEGFSKFQTPNKNKHKRLWGLEMSVSGNLLTVLKSPQATTNLLETTEDSTSVELDEQTINLQHDIVSENVEEGFVESQSNIALNQNESSSMDDSQKIRRILMTTHKYVLEDILICLICLNEDKWKSYDVEELYNKHLSSTTNIYKSLLLKEICEILKCIKHVPGKNLTWEKCENKLQNAQLLGYILGHVDCVETHKIKVKRMKSLRQFCWDQIEMNVPITVVRVAAAQWLFRMVYPKWLERSSVPVRYDVPCDYHEYNIFAYPEFHSGRQQIEPRIIDPSHCLTNMRVHATTKWIFNCNPEAFKAVSKFNNDLLSAGLVHEPLLDKQSVSYAEQVFSEEVANTMVSLGFHKEAKLVNHIRNWFDACNKRGLSVEKRIEYLIDINKYFMQFYPVMRYPMSCSHIRGLPSTTFQAILHNSSLRITLYHLSKQKTYNQRAVSTLSVESFFSDLSALARSNSGIPLTANIPRYLAKVTQMNNIKHDPTK